MDQLEISRIYELKSVDESGYFEGLCSVYGNRDSHGDVVVAGAFSKTINERGPEVPILAEHREAIGKGRVFDTATHLGITGRILTSIQRGRETLELAKGGVVRGLSIGYSVIKDQWDPDRKVRKLLEIKLFEVSLVCFPSNPEALVTTAKRSPEAERQAASSSEIAAALRELRRERFGRR